MTDESLQLRCQRCGTSMDLRDPSPGTPWMPQQYWVCPACGQHFWTTYAQPTAKAAEEKPGAAKPAAAAAAAKPEVPAAPARPAATAAPKPAVPAAPAGPAAAAAPKPEVPAAPAAGPAAADVTTPPEHASPKS